MLIALFLVILLLAAGYYLFQGGNPVQRPDTNLQPSNADVVKK